MNDELNNLLKKSHPPERSPGYWEAFPKRVSARLSEPSSPVTIFPWKLWSFVGSITVGALAIVAILFHHSGKKQAEAAFNYAQLYHQIEAMFPNQVQAIIVDQHGVRLSLADTADVPASRPLLISACRQGDCRHVITFSGQQVKVNGDTWDVLVNGQNQVVVAGPSINHYRIEAGTL